MQPDTFVVDHFPNLETLTRAKTSSRRLRICIATEEIVGPIANGGIASTYFDLARMLVSEGHKVTVLYLKGRICHHKRIEHWITHYANMGIVFTPLPEADICLDSAAPLWQNRQYMAWKWLNEQPAFDIVHTSEWRGGAYYALLAKKQGLAFRDTLFIVKTSSPHIWNRHYQMRFIDNQQMLGVMHPEQMTVELADMVIGGSAHLLSFMKHVGYNLPAARTFVQPNVILFDKLNVEDKRLEFSIGDIVKTDELVFFGRLEQRKGLEIFCVALDYIVAKGVHPRKVSFLGKEGTRVPSCPDLTPKEYIALHAKQWPFEVEIHDKFNQHAAISYMLARPCIAVMPSLIENSTMAAYEALVYRIPFIATRVGGTPELVKTEYHEQVLCGANPRDLARALTRTLSEGQVIAAPAFSNDHNINTWKKFHKFLAYTIKKRSVEDAIGEITSADNNTGADKKLVKPPQPRLLSICIAHIGDDALLRETLSGLRGTNYEVCLSTQDAGPEHTNKLTQELAAMGVDELTIIQSNEQTLGETYNSLANRAQGDCLVFLRSDIHVLQKSFTAALMSAFSNSHAKAFAPMHEQVDKKDEPCFHLPMGGDLSLGMLDYKTICGEVIAVRTETFTAVSGFSNLHGVGGLSQNLATRIINAGWRLETIPEVLYSEDTGASQWQLDESSAQFMMAMPLIQCAPLPLKKILLSSRFQHGNKKSKQPRKTAVPATKTSGLISKPAWVNDSGGNTINENQRPRVRIGVDLAQSIPLFGAFVVCQEQTDTPPELIIQNSGKALVTVPMINHSGGYFANWTLKPSLFGKEDAAVIKVRVAQEGETINELARTFSLQHNGLDTITIKGKKPVETWPDGRVPTENPRQYKWSNASLPHTSLQKSCSNLRIGFDENNPVIGIFANHPEACNSDTALLIECNGKVLEQLLLLPHRRGGAAKWAPNIAAIGSRNTIHLTIRVARNGDTVANMACTISLSPTEPGSISISSPTGVEYWPDADMPVWRSTLNKTTGTRRAAHKTEPDKLG